MRLHVHAAEQMRKRREFLKLRREEAKADDGAQVSIPAPDPPLPPTFDADVSAHRYRFLEQPGGWLARWVPPLLTCVILLLLAKMSFSCLFEEVRMAVVCMLMYRKPWRKLAGIVCLVFCHSSHVMRSCRGSGHQDLEI